VAGLAAASLLQAVRISTTNFQTLSGLAFFFELTPGVDARRSGRWLANAAHAIRWRSYASAQRVRTAWQGRSAMRISVSHWATRELNVERSVAAIIACARDAGATPNKASTPPT
jgi:hypothetical protein